MSNDTLDNQTLLAKVTALRDLNDGLTGILDGAETDRRDEEYRQTEDISEAIPGQANNMDLMSEIESGFELDHDERAKVDESLKKAENAKPIRDIHVERVEDALINRIRSLSYGMDADAIKRVLTNLGDTHDISFLN